MSEETQKAVIGSVRLDSDVWAAVRALPISLNQYLRFALLSAAPAEKLSNTTTTHVATPDAGKALRAALRKEAREINDRNRVPGDPHWKGELRKPKDRKKE